MEKDYSFKTFLKNVKKRIKLRHIFLIAILLTANSFAWFIYVNKVEGGMDAKIRAWDVDFIVDGGAATRYVVFDVDEIYPGMTTYTKSITITNDGESSAVLDFDVQSATILGVTTTASESGPITPDVLYNSLQNDYPFSMHCTLTGDVLTPGQTKTFTFAFGWPYESGNDAVDTYWGEESYNYSQLYPTSPSISITILIKATQTNN